MEVLLIRHGDPDYANDCLTAIGKKEAQYLANALEPLGIDDIYVSPLGRAQETCGFTTDRKAISPVVLDWLMERGIIRDELCLWEAPGEMFLRTAKCSSQNDWFDLGKIMPEGYEQFERVKRGFDALLATHGYVRNGDLYRVDKKSDKRIALFCHKGVILTLLADILHWPLPMIFVSLQIHPTGVTRLEMVEKNNLANFKALAINDLTHLHSYLSCRPENRTNQNAHTPAKSLNCGT
ncbi:MAG: histidine phosphatase family protein [Spirochaetales bacterium]|nr:histidine phosphatase family protein [Spirochaetales bacterium]